MTPSLACVILTMGDRPADLQRAVASVGQQQGVDVDIVVVSNGATGDVQVEGARVVALNENVGIPAGRNVGWREVVAPLVLFLDDDAWLMDGEVLRGAAARFRDDPALGVLSLHVVDEDGRTQRRHVPRLIVGDPDRGSQVTTFLGGASVIRRDVLEQVGGLPDEFFYAHEETSLAWRAIDHGWSVWYDGSLRVGHPHTPVSRHSAGRWRSARNRVLLARRHLPAPVGALHVLVWLLLTVVRDPAGFRDTVAGMVAGARMPSVPRDRLQWSTMWRLTRLGRPPVI